MHVTDTAPKAADAVRVLFPLEKEQKMDSKLKNKQEDNSNCWNWSIGTLKKMFRKNKPAGEYKILKMCGVWVFFFPLILAFRDLFLAGSTESFVFLLWS